MFPSQLSVAKNTEHRITKRAQHRICRRSSGWTFGPNDAWRADRHRRQARAVHRMLSGVRLAALLATARKCEPELRS
jgi:hypothetical protein